MPTSLESIGPDTPVVDLFGWHRSEHLRTATEWTLRLYGTNIKRFEKFLGREPLVSDLTPENISAGMDWLRSTGFSESTAAKFRVSIHSLSFCRERRKSVGMAQASAIAPKPFRVLPKRRKRRARKLAPLPIGAYTTPGDAINLDMPTPDSRLDRLAETYIVVRLGDANPGSHYKYRAAVGYLERMLGHPPVIADLNGDAVSLFASWMRRKIVYQSGDKLLSIDTVSMYHSRLLSLWRFACQRGILKVWPDQKKLRTPKRIPIAWTEEQLAKIFEAARNAEGKIGKLAASVFWTSILSVLWESGERISAILATRWEDVDLQAGTIIARAENRKGKTEDKFSKLHPDTCELLKAMGGDPREHVWPFPFSRDTLYSRYRSQVLKPAGVPFSSKHMFHCVRKSVASHFENAGGNATDLLGHSCRSVTLCYLAPDIVKRPQASELLPRPMKSKAK